MISRTVSWLTIAMLLGPMFVEAGITKITITNRATAFSGYDWAIQPKRSPVLNSEGRFQEAKVGMHLASTFPSLSNLNEVDRSLNGYGKDVPVVPPGT